MGALEWGLFGYAKGVLDNWLTYFIKDDGFVLYRGLEMAEHGRMLSNIAQYYQYTGDGELLLKHLDKIKGIGWLLNQRRDAALRNYPPTDSRYGMPTGNDEADLFWQTVSLGPKGNSTEMPFISIAAEMWRGVRLNFPSFGCVFSLVPDGSECRRCNRRCATSAQHWRPSARQRAARWRLRSAIISVLSRHFCSPPCGSQWLWTLLAAAAALGHGAFRTLPAIRIAVS